MSRIYNPETDPDLKKYSFDTDPQAKTLLTLAVQQRRPQTYSGHQLGRIDGLINWGASPNNPDNVRFIITFRPDTKYSHTIIDELPNSYPFFPDQR